MASISDPCFFLSYICHNGLGVHLVVREQSEKVCPVESVHYSRGSQLPSSKFNTLHLKVVF